MRQHVTNAITSFPSSIPSTGTAFETCHALSGSFSLAQLLLHHFPLLASPLACSCIRIWIDLPASVEARAKVIMIDAARRIHGTILCCFCASSPADRWSGRHWAARTPGFFRQTLGTAPCAPPFHNRMCFLASAPSSPSPSLLQLKARDEAIKWLRTRGRSPSQQLILPSVIPTSSCHRLADAADASPSTPETPC